MSWSCSISSMFNCVNSPRMLHVATSLLSLVLIMQDVISNSTIIVNFILFPNRFRVGIHHRISEMRYICLDCEDFLGSTIMSCDKIMSLC